MTRAVAEFQALTEALEDTTPACRDDWRFLLDENVIDPPDVLAMKAVCRGCPVATLCAAYAAVARPEAGMWAGNYYKPRKYRGHESKENHHAQA